MQTSPIRLVTALAIADMRSISRNSLMILFIIMPLMAALIFRFTIPDQESLIELAQQNAGVRLQGFEELIGKALVNLHALLMAIFVGLSASMIGAAYGLLLVEEREDRVLPSINVMPVAFSWFVLARLLPPTLLSTIVTTAAYPIAGMAPLPMMSVLLIAIAGATLVPVMTLGVVAFAPGRVAALALVRIFTLLAVLPAITLYISPPAEWIFAPIGSYWQMRSLWGAIDGAPFAGLLVICVMVNAIITLIFYRILAKRPE